MSSPLSPKPVKLIVSILSGDKSLFACVSDELSYTYGRIGFISTFISFTTTTYYQAEMGEGLARRFVTFEKPIKPAELPEVKRRTDEVEAKHKNGGGNRRINCDPGYLTLDQLVLATNKKCSHRPYLRAGVYADLTLIYRGKSFQPLEWTYPDYGSAEIIEIMNRLRECYKIQLKEFGFSSPREEKPLDTCCRVLDTQGEGESG